MQQVTHALDHRHGNAEDPEYDAFIVRIQARLLSTIADGRLFMTDAGGLWDAYLSGMAPESRQYHTCTACRHFIERFGALVVIGGDGRTTPALWDVSDAPAEYVVAIGALARLCARARVTGVFLHKEDVWGTPVTGIWHHFAVTPPRTFVHPTGLLTAGQAMAEKREDFNTVSRALSEWKRATVEQALVLLRSDALYRSEKVLGQAEWLHALQAARDAAKGHKANIVWRAIATAPAGFCHPRGSMIGTLLDDIEAGKDFAAVSASFKAKMHPLQYQRPTAAPTSGAIVAAEKLIETLGLAPSLERRFARLDEIETVWTPAPVVVPADRNGVFGHLQAKGETAPELVAPPVVMTWEKFARTVLPTARTIEVNAPMHGNYVTILTAANPGAPPLLQWDHAEQRNPFSWYLYNGGSPAPQYGIAPGWRALSALSLAPHQWHGRVTPHYANWVVCILPGAVDTRDSGNALFPDTLRAELHGIRAVVEAYAKTATIRGRDAASACGLLCNNTSSVFLRVATDLAPRVVYKIDRLD